MQADATNSANLLVRASLEALLTRAANRFDAKARTERILAATLMACAEKGYASVTIGKIAVRAKVSTATIYESYKDRDALLVAAIEMLFEILAGDVIEIPPTNDPLEQVQQLLVAHGQVYSEPLAVWFFRLYASLSAYVYPHLRETGQKIFDKIDAFWAALLDELVRNGHLVAFDPSFIVPVLLGPIERCTIIAQLSFGETEAYRPQLNDVAQHSAETLFRLWGSETWHQSRGFERTNSPALVALAENSETEIAEVSIPTSFPNAQARLDEALVSFRTQQTPEKQKYRVLLATAIVCQQKGYGLANVSEIAVLAHVSTATVYKYFADKADVFSSAFEVEFERLTEHFLSHPASLQAASIPKILSQIAGLASDPNWIWLHNLMMASELSCTPRVLKCAQSHRQELENKLAKAVSAQNNADLAIHLNFLLGSIERSGLLTMILFGSDAVKSANLQRLSTLMGKINSALNPPEFLAQ